MAKLVIFCVLTLLAVTWGCPRPEDLYPCSCKEFQFAYHVECANFNSSASLENAFKSLEDRQVGSFLMHGLHIEETLPRELFVGLHVKHLTIEQSKLKFSPPFFNGLNLSLVVLNVMDDSIQNEEFSFAKLTKLQELTIHSNRIGKLRDDWLHGAAPNLTIISLDSNQIDEVDDYAFADFKSLKIISLALNRIKIVKRSMFSRPDSQLKRIDLSFNKIETLPDDIFKEMHFLTEIVLSGNKLTTLPKKIWVDIWQNLNQVLLYGNQLICDEELEWIKELKKPYIFDGTCVQPQSMMGKSVNEIYED